MTEESQITVFGLGWTWRPGESTCLEPFCCETTAEIWLAGLWSSLTKLWLLVHEDFWVPSLGYVLQHNPKKPTEGRRWPLDVLFKFEFCRLIVVQATTANRNLAIISTPFMLVSLLKYTFLPFFPSSLLSSLSLIGGWQTEEMVQYSRGYIVLIP